MSRLTNHKYLLVTPVFNEEAHIERTLRAVLKQTVLPVKWIVVDDGSTDRTAQIVSTYESQYPFLELVRVGGDHQRSFSAKVKAFRMGYERGKHVGHDFVGNLDGDVSFDRTYFEKVMQRFGDEPNLGIAGGLVFELTDGRYEPQRMSQNSVAGAVQLFRRGCYEEIGGYTPLDAGGIDSAAEIKARMHGWKVRTFPDLKVFHCRRVSSGMGNILSTRFRQGRSQYLLGYHPLFQICRCVYRMRDKPYFLGGLLLLLGYFSACLQRGERVLSDGVVRYLQLEQKRRLRSGFFGFFR